MPGATEEDEWGVRPNEGLDVALSNRDMRRLARSLQQSEIPRGGIPVDEEQAEEEPFVDASLQKAIDYLQKKLAEEERELTQQ
jgi:hypothetical protein